MRSVLFLTSALLAPAAGGAAATLEVEHMPATCVPADRYLRIDARGVPAAEAARAELQFRADAAGPWYSIAMTAGPEGWTAFLPRPSAALERFEYRIAATARDAASVVSGPYAVRVGRGPEECGATAPPALEAPIAVTVPAGAPVTPPVPAGFSPAGVVAAEGARSSHRGLKIAGAIVAGAVGIATAAGVASSTSEPPATGPPTVPDLRFNAIRPPPGSVIALGRDTLVVELLMATEPAIPMNLGWQVSLEAGGEECVIMFGVFNGVQRPLGLALTGPFRPPGCRLPLETDTVHIYVTHRDQIVYDQSLRLPYRIEP
jgi:hypothetical protein